MRGRAGAAVTSAATPADLAAALSSAASSEHQERLRALRDALMVFTRVQFAAGGTPDPAALSAALEAARAEAGRLARERRWRPRRTASSRPAGEAAPVS
jgi:hypothetical protein